MEKERWHDKEFTAKWDRQIAESYPSRALQVNLLVSMLAGLYEPGKWVVDLGFGSGRIEEQVLRQRGDAQIIGIDSSAAMIDLARERLTPWAGQYQALRHDLTHIDSVDLPAVACQIAMSVQVLHHLPQDAQRNLYRWTHRILEPGGWYFIIDKRSLAGEDLAPYEHAWNALEQNPQWRTGRSFAEHLEFERSKGHSPATLPQALDWLREAGFSASCLHAHLDRYMLVARKS